MTADTDGILAIDRLKDHYKHCIRLSASNKINPKNAFDLQLIDYMQDLVSSTEDGQMNFKIASSALDVGAKIYSNRVDCIQSEAQKVASSILMALDGQPHSEKNNPNDTTMNGDTSATSDRLNDSREGEDESHAKENNKKKRPNRNKNVKTVVDDPNLIDAKLEKMVLGDPFLDGLSQDYDMSCPAALICYNALTQPNCLLTIESSHLRKDYRESKNKTQADLEAQPQADISTDSASKSSQDNYVTLITKNNNCAQIIRSNQNNRICPRLEHFLFNDRTTVISGLEASFDDSKLFPREDNPLNISSTKSTGGAHEFNPHLYAGNDDFGDDHFGDAESVVDNCERQTEDRNENDLIPNLDKIAASVPTDYGYSNEHHRLLNTWAGPHAWKVIKAPQTAKKDLAPKSGRKRAKLEQKPIDFEEELLDSLEKIADKDIRHSADVIKRWKKPLLPQDHNLTEETIRTTLIHTFLRPEDTYHCMKTPADALKLVDIDHDYTKTDRDINMEEAPLSPAMGGFDDVHDDSDDEFRADPVVDGNEVALYGIQNDTLTDGTDLEFAGEHLIEQPYTVAQVNIPFAKIAKKMDVRKLKRVMWDLLFPPEKRLDVTMIESASNQNVTGGDEHNETVIMVNGNQQDTSGKTPSPTPSESTVHLEFSNLYGEIPVRVSSKMASDLSQPIAFVTLLHLANEKNLKLIPKQDLKDFIIENDQ